MDKDDGGAAFPQEVKCGTFFTGLSVRDYFAAKALQGFWASDDLPLPEDKTPEQCRAELCAKFYEWADAMIAERAK